MRCEATAEVGKLKIEVFVNVSKLEFLVRNGQTIDRELRSMFFQVENIYNRISTMFFVINTRIVHKFYDKRICCTFLYIIFELKIGVGRKEQ